MADIENLKRLTDACDIERCADEEERDRNLNEFYSTVEPEDVAALIAENEALRTSSGFNELALLRMGFRQACEERDRLKAENERLRKDVKDHADARAHYCGKVGEIAGERDQLKAELERVRAEGDALRTRLSVMQRAAASRCTCVTPEQGARCTKPCGNWLSAEDVAELVAAGGVAMGKGGEA